MGPIQTKSFVVPIGRYQPTSTDVGAGVYTPTLVLVSWYLPMGTTKHLIKKASHCLMFKLLKKFNESSGSFHDHSNDLRHAVTSKKNILGSQNSQDYISNRPVHHLRDTLYFPSEVIASAILH